MGRVMDALLGRKSSATANSLVAVAGRRPQWTPRQYDKLAREGYQSNVWVYACVTEITRAVKGVDWKLYRKARNGRRTDVDTHPIIDLWGADALRPGKANDLQSGAVLREQWAGFLMLAGNAYMECVGLDGRPPVELYQLRPDRMRVVPGTKVGMVDGYAYKVGGHETAFDAGAILHTKLFHPLSDWYGMSPIEAAAYAIDQHNASGAWNKSLLDNYGRPYGVFKLEEGATLTDEQEEQLEEKWQNKTAGFKNAGRPLLLEGGVDWQQVSLTPAEMDWLKGRAENANEIAATYGMPGEIIGLKEGTYENRREARKALYTEVVLPLLDVLRDQVNAQLCPRWDDVHVLDYDRDGIEALQEDRDRVYTRVQASHFMTLDEKREAVGLDAIGGEVGAMILVPATMVVLDEDMAAPAPAPDDQPPADDPNDGGDDQGDDQGEDDTADPPDEGSPEAGARYVRLNPWGLQNTEQKERHWLAVDTLRKAWERAMAQHVRKLLKAEGERVAAAVAKSDQVGATEAALGAVDPVPWEKRLQAVYLACMEDFGERVQEQLGWQPTRGKGAFDGWEQAVQRYVEGTVALKVKGITATTRTILRTVIGKDVAAGMSMDDIARDIRLEYAAMGKVRSLTIARTEVIGASSAGSQWAAKATGLRLQKEWIATPGPRTRHDHADADGQLQDLDDPYMVGGYAMRFPGDPSAPAKQVVNCRCAEGYHRV